jgi:hypothetical protein
MKFSIDYHWWALLFDIGYRNLEHYWTSLTFRFLCFNVTFYIL